MHALHPNLHLQILSWLCNLIMTIRYEGLHVKVDITLTWSFLRTSYLMGNGKRLRGIFLVLQRLMTIGTQPRSFLRSGSRISLRHWTGNFLFYFFSKKVPNNHFLADLLLLASFILKMFNYFTVIIIQRR